MRILFVSPRQCWPLRSGAALREYHLARALGERVELTHVFFAQAGARTPGLAEMPFCRKIVPVPAPQRYTPLKILRGILGRKPLPLVNYTSNAMKAALASLVAAEPFDLVHADSLHMAAYEPILRSCGAPVVYDWHNIESEGMRRYSANSPSPARKAYASLTARRLAALEREILRSAAGHVVCSERERETLLSRAPEARIVTIENGADVRSFEETQPAAERRRILFVGWMSYHANIEAAVNFTRTVWPGIRERFPGWRLTLAGRDPAPAVVALGSEANVEVTGTVEDIRPYYGEAVAAIVPLRTGGGTRLKILEAMAAGVPVVSTPLGAEGLAVSPGLDILIAENDEDWLAQLSALSTREDLWNRLADAGRRLVTARYDWEALGQALYETYCRWIWTPR
jgi:glycosyltransferase involved in cell wall biosynthesis